MKFKRTTSDEINFKILVEQLDQYLRIVDGEDHAFYAQFNKTDNIQQVIVCFIDELAVGCGAFKMYDNETAEIKRMFVLPEFRGKGIAAAMLKELEKWAAEFSYSACILETGFKQIEAIALYKKSGYHIIPNYGQYENIDNSVCMNKRIK